MAVDYFLKLDGIPGESTDAKHKDEIDVLAFSWGVSHPKASGPGGGGAGKAVFEDLLVVAHTSKASPKLWLACASGQHIKSAILTCRKPGKAPLEFLKITLTDVLISSYEIDGSDEEPPLDQIALAFAKVETVYTPQDPTGKAQPPVKAAWDLKKNAKV
ncbi:MAG TPA: type VI secretion system tube protein Hcp [Gaiellaceae bacterium]|jgi:type VI secretion system secreted protein Hcp|nr:type VI secretion system tube protein Hcp [Gaiellaceae bacterium]